MHLNLLIGPFTHCAGLDTPFHSLLFPLKNTSLSPFQETLDVFAGSARPGLGHDWWEKLKSLIWVLRRLSLQLRRGPLWRLVASSAPRKLPAGGELAPQKAQRPLASLARNPSGPPCVRFPFLIVYPLRPQKQVNKLSDPALSAWGSWAGERSARQAPC